MRTLRRGSTGSQVELLQLALLRSGFAEERPDGSFGRRTEAALRRFQRAMGLTPDGVAGPRTHSVLRPWYTGYIDHILRPGDSFYSLAQRWGTTVRAIETANPGADPMNLRPGEALSIPLGFAVVPTDINWCSDLVRFCCRGIAARYPSVVWGDVGQSAMGTTLERLRLGRGDNRVFYNAAHHANEWITAPLLLRFAEELARAGAYEEELGGVSAAELLEGTVLDLVPCVNPDGMDLVTGALQSGPNYDTAREIADGFPGIAFPEGWKANIQGVDLNLQYPALWERAREIKYAQGFTRPAPRDFVGYGPLTAPESLALYQYTLYERPALTLSYHTQGRVIYWKYLDLEPPGAREIAYRFSAASGYAVEETPYASGFAGYKDWFIQDFNRPGYTVEAGIGDNPLPLSQFDTMYEENLGILTLGMLVTRR